ncbi:MAG: dienelactone hydrolase family protein, partial [Acidimicrobiales bacterium]
MSAADPAPAPPAPAPLTWGEEDATSGGVRRRRFDVGGSVPGLLWTPADGAPSPLVLIGHGGSGSKSEHYVAGLARRLVLRHRTAAAAIDGPVHGDRRPDPDAPPGLVLLEWAQRWANDGEAMTDGMVADWRATIDALAPLPEIGDGPVGWWGLSLGTILGLPLVAADERIGAAVLGLMGLTGPTRERIGRDAARVRCPVLFFVQWDDTLFPRRDALA